MAFYSYREPIVTERLRLRPLRDADALALFGWQSDAESTRYLPYRPRSMEQVADVVSSLSRVRGLLRDRDRLVFAVELGESGRVIGELHFVLKDASAPECELGWVFAPDMAGLGYATEAARAVPDTAFAAGAHRVIAVLDPRNTASARVCARLGMQQEAHFVRNWRNTEGGWDDTAVWAVLRDATPAG